MRKEVVESRRLCPASAERMKAVALEVMRSLSNRTVERLNESLAEDVVLEFPFAIGDRPERVEGVGSVLAAVAEAQRRFSSFQLKSTATYAAPGRRSVILEAEGTGTLRNGGGFANRSVVLFTFRDGKIVLWREYFDSAKLSAIMTTEDESKP